MKRRVPTRIYLETTNLCNAACLMCPHERMTREKGVMSRELFVRAVSEIAGFESDRTIVYLQKDGEPLMDPHLIERILYARGKLRRSRLHLITNAMRLDARKSAALLDTGIDRITFSVDGASKKTYEGIRRGLDYDIVRRNLETFFRLREKSTSRSHVTIQMVVSPLNRHEIPRFRELWVGKADSIFFKAMHGYLDAPHSTMTKHLFVSQRRSCLMPFTHLIVFQNGDIGICCWDYDHFAEVGNLEDGSIPDIFNNREFERIRSAHRNRDCAEIEPCNRCPMIYGEDYIGSYPPARAMGSSWLRSFKNRLQILRLS